LKKSSKKCLKKSLLKKIKNITNCWRRGREEGREGGREEGREGGRRIVISMPEAINFSIKLQTLLTLKND
jgi:hypothetical protein